MTQYTPSALQKLIPDTSLQAEYNRKQFEAHQVLVINLISSPGAGKTSLLETTIKALKSTYRIAVMSGNVKDAERIHNNGEGIETLLIQSGSACHFDAQMITEALQQTALSSLDLLFIESIGSLACPICFQLGQHHNITLLSVTEGDDKPGKYPQLFRASDQVLLTKSDLLPYLKEFSPQRVQQALHQLNSHAVDPIQLSAKQGEGIELWLDWLRREIQQYRDQLQKHPPIRASNQPLNRMQRHYYPHVDNQ